MRHSAILTVGNATIKTKMPLQITTGDLLDQSVEAIVNPWNRNFIPAWLLWPHGVSGAIKKRAGFAPFHELRTFGILQLGQAIATSAGKLPFRNIIHVAGLQWTWTASEISIRRSTSNALILASETKLRSLAFPLIGAGTGGIGPDKSLRWMTDEIERAQSHLEIIIVRFGEPK